MREQRLLGGGEGIVDLSHRGVISVTGPDRLTWLHSLTTQNLEGLEPGRGVTTLVLSPHGHIEYVLYGVDDGETFWAHTEPGSAPALVSWLDRMRFLMRVEVRDRSAEYAVVWSAAQLAGERAPPSARLENIDGRCHSVPFEQLEPNTGSESLHRRIW